MGQYFTWNVIGCYEIGSMIVHQQACSFVGANQLLIRHAHLNIVDTVVSSVMPNYQQLLNRGK